MELIFAAIAGLVIGSFFNVLLVRLLKGEEGILWGRSQCPHCKKNLGWYDLVPVISYLWLRGQCRHCRHRISLQYPLVEVGTALVLTLFVYVRGVPVSMFEYAHLVLLLGFVLLALFDYKYLILPDVVMLPMVAVVLIYHSIVGGILYNLEVGFLSSLLFAILYVVSQGRWVGFGDVKLSFLVGLAFGYPFGILVLVAAIWAAALVGIVLLASQRGTVKTALPFGSFLAATSSIYIIYFYVFQTFRWYF